MKKGILVNLNRFKLLNYVTLNKIFILLCVFYVIGIVLGSTVLSKNSWLSQNTKLLFENLLSVHSNNNFLKKFFSCFMHYFVILILYFLSGASLLGVVVTPFITVWQGIIIGSITSYLYAQYGLSGIAFNAIILIPPLAIFIVCCFFAARYAIDFSLNIAKLTLPKCRPMSLYVVFKGYCSKYLIFIGIAVICTLMEIILNLFFLNFFNF